MFDPVKVNQNSIINLLKNPERETSDLQSKNPGNDFFSMVMEKRGYDDINNRVDNKPYQVAEPQKNVEKNEPVKTEQLNTVSKNPVAAGRNERESNLEGNKNNSREKTDGDTVKQELKTEDTKKNSNTPVREDKSKKNGKKDSEDEIGIINKLHDESNIKNLMEIIKAAFSGNKKAEEESLQKLFSNLKPKQEKNNTTLTSSFKKNDADKNQKGIPELLNLITKELKDTVSKELFKNIDSRKPVSKSQMLNDKELKELASNIIDSIKKNKAKEIVKHEAKVVLNDDVKNDKKPVILMDQQPLKKTETADDSSFEKNGSKEKNSGKDNFSYNGGKIEFSAKSGLEKMEHIQKMSDFKENLQEIIDKAKVTVRDSRNGTFTVRLNPQELGNVNVNLIMENGVITGKFLVDNEDVKSMLLSSLNDLKYQLEEAGIAVGEFSVNVNDQREKYLKQKDDESFKSLSLLNSDKEVIAAAEQYNSAAAAHNGHINMVI
ncbi:MAG TPA: flagellar hook-length control protein FliK [Spirochaetota bacterium]|nr:flagellar hook-length control protein FliK [Spirochaetota bacterium]HPS85931.1 flagellar hook-length control protein FliK [Spirochaetota bacterium]